MNGIRLRRKRARCIADLKLTREQMQAIFKPKSPRERSVLKSFDGSPVKRIDSLCTRKLKLLRAHQDWNRERYIELYKMHEESTTTERREMLRDEMDRLSIVMREILAAINLKAFGDIMYEGFEAHPADVSRPIEKRHYIPTNIRIF